MSEWPHDPDGEDGSEGRRKYGQAILAKKLDEDADFPLDCDEFVEEHADEPIRIDYDVIVSVADIFEGVDQQKFEDFPDFHTTVGQAMRDQGYWPYELA